MKAIVQDAYCSPDGLALREIGKPEVGPDTILVRVRAAAVNPLDWHTMRGEPYVMRLVSGLRQPKQRVRGVDVAGEVEAVGGNVTRFKPGDVVFGSCGGAFAEYVSGRERNFTPKPAGLTFEQAASMCAAGCSALQGLRDQGQLQPGQSVLINGASGGVGTFAVQIATALGAVVTGVCSARNVDLVRSLGAAEVIDYTRTDFTRTGERYDVILDAVGNRSLSDLRRAATPEGTLVLLGGGGGRWLGPLTLMLKGFVMSRFVGQKLRPFVAQPRNSDMVYLKELIDSGKLTPVIDRTYRLVEVPEAMRYVEQGHAQGKVVMTVSAPRPPNS